MRINELTLDNCPDFIGAFHASGIEEGFDRMQEKLLVGKKETVVWSMDPLSLSEAFNPHARQLHAEFVTKYGCKNQGLYEHDFTSGCPLVGVMSPAELQIAEYFNFRNPSELKVTKRVQITDPDGTVATHLDLWVGSEGKETLELESPFPDRPFGGRRIRLLLTQNGEGPIFYEKPDKMELEPAAKGKDGLLVNKGDLRHAWKLPGNSLIAVTVASDWGCQAGLHESPRVRASPLNPRIQTLYEVKF